MPSAGTVSGTEDVRAGRGERFQQFRKALAQAQAGSIRQSVT